LDARSKALIELRVTYSGHIVAWFSFLFMIHAMNPPQRTVSALVLVAFAVAAVYAIAVGFVMRKKFFTQSTEVFRDDPQKALNRWKVAHFFGFSCATSVTVFGVAMKFLGAGWLVPGIFFAVGLAFLVLWRPRSNLPFS
jgi:putative Mn2+ efflux pump MntP